MEVGGGCLRRSRARADRSGLDWGFGELEERAVIEGRLWRSVEMVSGSLHGQLGLRHRSCGWIKGLGLLPMTIAALR